MSVIETHDCDVCGKMKTSDANRWFMLKQIVHSIATLPWPVAGHELEDPVIKVGDVGIFHACGEEHAAILYSRWLTSGKLERLVDRHAP